MKDSNKSHAQGPFIKLGGQYLVSLNVEPVCSMIKTVNTTRDNIVAMKLKWTLSVICTIIGERGHNC